MICEGLGLFFSVFFFYSSQGVAPNKSSNYCGATQNKITHNEASDKASIVGALGRYVRGRGKEKSGHAQI